MPLLPLANWFEGRVRLVVEASGVGDPQLKICQASVTWHDGSRAVLEAGLRRVLEGVVNELRAVRRPAHDALWTADDSIPRDDVVLTPRGIYHSRASDHSCV